MLSRLCWKRIPIKIRAMGRRVCDMRHERKLRKIQTHEEFYKYVLKVHRDEFLNYKNWSNIKRTEFKAAVKTLGICLAGINFLDLGPGFGDALDICHESGAKNIEYVDIDPFFYHYNRLKEYAKGHYFSFVTGLHKLPGGTYNFLWLKGGINVEYFIKMEVMGIRYRSMEHWLRQLESLMSSNGHIILCPLWRHDGKKRLIDDIYDNSFTRTMLKTGFSILPKIPDFCEDLAHPVAFHKIKH